MIKLRIKQIELPESRVNHCKFVIIEMPYTKFKWNEVTL